MHLVALYQLAVGQKLAEALGSLDLSHMWTNGMHDRRERIDAAVEGIERHSCDGIGPLREALSLQQRPDGKGTHVLCAVEQSQSFLRCHADGFPIHALQHLCARDHLALHLHFAFADKRQRQVGQRHKVSRGSERALPVDHGGDVVIEEVDESLHGVELAARIAIAERLYLQ